MLCTRQMAFIRFLQVSDQFSTFTSLFLIEPAIEDIVLDFGINYTLEEETVINSSGKRILVILFDRIVAEDQSVHRFAYRIGASNVSNSLFSITILLWKYFFWSFRSGISG